MLPQYSGSYVLFDCFWMTDTSWFHIAWSLPLHDNHIILWTSNTFIFNSIIIIVSAWYCKKEEVDMTSNTATPWIVLHPRQLLFSLVWHNFVMITWQPWHHHGCPMAIVASQVVLNIDLGQLTPVHTHNSWHPAESTSRARQDVGQINQSNSCLTGGVAYRNKSQCNDEWCPEY